MTRIGIWSEPPSIAEIVELAREAEAAGLDSVWTGEYFNRNAFSTLTAMAAATSRITIGSDIAYAFPRAPVQLAMAAADVDEVSGGRLVLGLGTGARGQNEQWYGVPFDHPGPRLRETVEVIRSLWRLRDGHFRYEGRFFRLSIPHFVRPCQVRPTIPVYLGAANPHMLRLAGRVADGLLGHLTYTRSYYREVVLPSLYRGVREAGRGPGDVERVLGVLVVVDPDGRRARRDASMWLALYYVARAFHTILDYHGWEEEKRGIVEGFRARDPERMAAAVSERMWRDAMVLAGTPDEVRRQFDTLSGLADHVNLLAPAPYGPIPYDRYRENYRLLLEIFGRSV